MSEIESLFDAALERPRHERGPFLDRACGDNRDLRTEIESLLQAHDESGDFLNVPLVESFAGEIAAVAESPQGSLVGTQIGPFTLEEPIGRGGMGVVYRAERRDGDFSQRVAIKIVDLSLDRPGVLHRFRAERHILATLQHPHIVSLLDGGVTPGGRAYLVMEYVEGVPITAYCSAKKLPLADRLALVESVCGAVQYAHQRGVVHCDLKPANILVTPDGIPKILDFGIAHLIRGPEQAGIAETTGTGIRPLTPNYASPEQLRGLPMTTASDIYALGVLLYELLAGVPPYQLSRASLEEVLEQVLDRDPRKPSGVTAADNLIPYPRRLLKGDLDAIVLKALRKTPAERYASARELGDDLQRSRRGEPVVAREPSLRYLLGRLARRHRTGVIGTAVAGLALVASLGAALWQARLARAENQRATERFTDARQLAEGLVFKLEQSVAELPGSTPVRRQIVTEALTYLERLSQDPAGDDALRVDLARAYHRVGDIQGNPSIANLGDRDAAVKSLSRGIALLTPLTTGQNPSRDAQIELARSKLSLSNILQSMGRKAESVQLAVEAATVSRAVLARDPKDNDGRRALASSEFALAVDEQSAGRDLPHWEAAGQTFDSLLADDPTNADKQRNVALVEKYIGAHYEKDNDFEHALPHFLRAKAMDEARLTAHPNDRTAQFDVAIDLANVANSQQGTGHPQESAATYERSLTIRETLAAFDPNDVLARSRVAFVHTRLSDVYGELGQYPAALMHAHEAVKLAESMAGLDVTDRIAFARNLMDLGVAETRAGDAPSACVDFGRSADVLAIAKQDKRLDKDALANLQWIDDANTRGLKGCRGK